MTEPSGNGIDPNVVEELLSLPTLEKQTAFLRSAGLLNAGGLDPLLDVADRLLNDDPGKARRLAELCAQLANAVNAPAAVPRATYIRAGAHNLNGEFEEDLRLTKAAYEGYIALGMNLEALRTNVGRMSALLHLGRYNEALDTGRIVLAALVGKGELNVSPTSREIELLTAVVFGNFGLCYEYMGRYKEALEAHATAGEYFKALDMVEHLGEVNGNRGAILSHLGRGTEALEAHEITAALFKEAGLTLFYVKALGNIGEDYLQLADYTRSLDAFAQARRLLKSLDALAEEHFILRNTADAYLALNLYSEALAAYREADNLLRATGMAHDHARVLWGMGSTLIARSEFEEAERALDEAATLFAQADNVPLLSGVMLEQASVLETQGQRDAALLTASRALVAVSGDGWPVQRVYAHMRLADLFLPDTNDAESHLIEARRLSENLTLPHLRYRLDERLGRLRLLQGRNDEAQMLLEAAVDKIETLRGTLAQETMRASFLQDKTAAYEGLLRLHLDQEGENASRRAFVVAERAKSRALVDLLTGVVDARPVAPADSELEDKLQRLQSDLNATYSRFLSGPGDDEYEISLPDMNVRAVELEEEISRLRLQPAAASNPSRSFADAMPSDGIQEKLPENTLLLAYHLVEDEIIAFLHAGGRIRVVRRVGTVSEVQRLLQRLTVQWDRFRMGSEFAGRNMALLERSVRQLLAAVYAKLVAPLEPVLEEAGELACGGTAVVQKLVIVPHGLLHQVPFHALFDGERYLIERFEISYAPSATVYALCQERKPSGSGRALVFGAEDPSIPAATLEARTVAEQLPGADVRIGSRATVGALRSETTGCDTLHLACHGLFRSDNPMFSSLKLHDNWLTAADAMNLDLSGALVALSACESGRNEVIGGDEVIGLTRAFLGAGASTLVVSLWLAQDETTAALMSNWYRRMGNGEGRAAALRAAQLEIKEGHPHPYYWAPFVLTGRR